MNVVDFSVNCHLIFSICMLLFEWHRLENLYHVGLQSVLFGTAPALLATPGNLKMLHLCIYT